MKLRSMTVLMVSGLVALSAQAFEIKGISPGMSKKDFVAKFGEPPLSDFTIATIAAKFNVTAVKFDGKDRLASLYFVFDLDEFDDMLDAIKSKYPAMRCRSYTITNRSGVRVPQRICELEDSTGLLSLTRLNVGLNGSVLSILSKEERDAILKEHEERINKDI